MSNADIRQAAMGGPDFTVREWPDGRRAVTGYCRRCGGSDGWLHSPDCPTIARCDHDYYTEGCDPCSWLRSEIGQ